MAVSNAVPYELQSTVVGYKIAKGDFSNTTGNLPQRITVLAEANTANQAGISSEPFQFTTAKQVADEYGAGSPAHIIARILRPVNGGSGVAGIPTFICAQPTLVGATAKVVEVTATASSGATANVTHTLIVAGRRGIDGKNYDFVVNTGDTASDIHQKISDAISNVTSSPVKVNGFDDESVAISSKWKGLTANGITISVDTNGNAAGITYSFAETTSAAGTPDVQDALDTFDPAWNTIVINSYGTVASVVNALEAFNGIPDPDAPTGEYEGIKFHPFIAFTGHVTEQEEEFTEDHKTQVTIALCPAPNSTGLAMEAAANFALLQSRTSQDDPKLDIQGRYLPDMPTPTSIGLMANYLGRNEVLAKGGSTVELVSGQYRVCDFVTTYHPEGESPAQFQYVRNLMVDFNVKYEVYLAMQQYVIGAVLVGDNAIVEGDNVLKPSQWKAKLVAISVDLERRGLITDAPFMQDSILVAFGETNPNRLESSFRYKRTGIGRIASTTAEAGFNFNN